MSDGEAEMNEAAQEVRDLIHRDHQRSIAEWEAKADAAASLGDERRRLWCQGVANDLKQIVLPWEKARRAS